MQDFNTVLWKRAIFYFRGKQAKHSNPLSCLSDTIFIRTFYVPYPELPILFLNQYNTFSFEDRIKQAMILL